MTNPTPLFSPNHPRPGRLTYSVSQYEATLAEASPARRLSMLGHSPGKAAQLLGISRQAVHDAIDRGALEAFYVHDDDTGDLRWIVIPDRSLRAYSARRKVRKQA